MHAIPRSRSSAIPRHRLLELLSDWPQRRLICIVAPAGYGKSMLAADWIRSLAALPSAQQSTQQSAQRPDVAWLSLHESLDAERCLHTLAQELLPLVPALQAVLSLDGGGHYSPAQRMRMLCAELAAAERPIVLVVDDFHLITDPAALALFQQLLDHTPDHLHLVLVSRTFPDLRVDRLVLDDAILILDQHDLAVRHDEFLQLVPLLGLASQPAAALEELEQRCSGWIAGLKLLAHDTLRCGTPAHVPPGLSGSALLQFVESRILASLSDPLRMFARIGAQLPWMSADLLAAATGASPAECSRMLAELVASNAFVVEFDAPDGPRFRFHPLVQEALRNDADAAASDALRRRAAAWFLQRDDVDAALYVLGPTPFPISLAPDMTRVVRRALLRFDLAAARRWLAAPPAELLDSHAPLAVAAAWTEFLAESIPPFDAALRRARDVLQRCPPPASDIDELRRDVAVLNVYRHMLDHDMDAAARELATAEAIPASTDSLGGGYLFLMQSLVQRDANTHEACIHLLQQAAAVFERIGYDSGVVAMLFASVSFQQRHADLHGAFATSLFLQGFTQQRSLVHIPYARENLLIQGQFLYLLDRIPEAQEILREFLKQSASYDETGAHYVARVHLQLCDAAAVADPAAVLRKIDAVEDAAHWTQILELEWRLSQSAAAWPRIVREHRAGHPERCRQTAESLRIGLDALDDQTPAAIRLAVLAGAVLGNDDDPTLAAHLEQLLAHVEAIQMPFIALQVRLLQTIHAHRRGHVRSAAKVLRVLLPDLERSGARRLLLDFPELHPLARRCAPDHAARLLPWNNALVSPETADPQARFTPQEIRILDQLATGMGAKEIAAAHTLSCKTVYGHLQNIYRKLGVHSRAEAVRVWRGREE